MSKNILTDKDIEKYLKAQKKRLSDIYSCEETNEVISFMRNNINEYINEHPECTIEEIKYNLNLSDLYVDWAANTTTTNVIKKINYRSILRKIELSIILILGLIILFYSLSIGIEKWIAQTAIDNVQLVDSAEVGN